jgi:phage antirepressor YoqD-like protein
MTSNGLITTVRQPGPPYNYHSGCSIASTLKLHSTLTARLDEINHLVRPSAYSQRDLSLDQKIMKFDDTARLLGTSGIRLREYLRDRGVLGWGRKNWNRVTRSYKNSGHFISRNGSHAFSPQGRLWLHDLACSGALDAILDRAALIERLAPSSGLPFCLSDVLGNHQ